jgi:hypothetical protein
MIILPQTSRSTWSSNGIDVQSTIFGVGRELHCTPGRFASYRPLYTVVVEYGEKRLRVRAVANAEAIEWAHRLVYAAFVELGTCGAVKVGG